MITLFESGQALLAGRTLRLGDEQARHARARRVAVGEIARIVDGRGYVAAGQITALGRGSVDVQLTEVKEFARPAPLEAIVPVADRDRMLLAAEKCVELQITAWRPVYFARSRSVSPRGEGPKFRDKVIARMRAALEQCGAAWMPDVYPEIEGIDALRAAPSAWQRVLFDASGQPFRADSASVPTIFAVGPEGGWDDNEIAAARDGRWTFASLANGILRFETAIIAAAAVIRATQLANRG